MKPASRISLLGLAGLALSASANAAVVFFDDFENGLNDATVDDTTGGYSQTANVSGSTYSVSNTSRSYNTTLWVDTTTGFGSDRQGLINENAVNEVAVLPPEGGSQAYAFRYTNSGVTTASGVIGALTVGTTITVSFNVFVDAFNGGNNYAVYLATFNGGTRVDMDDGGPAQGTTALLARAVGAATSEAYQTVSFSYTVGDDMIDQNGDTVPYNSAVLGHDIAIRFDGQTSAASWDNVSVDITVVPEPSAALLGSLGLLALLRRRR